MLPDEIGHCPLPQVKPLFSHAARAYVVVLFCLEALLFAASLLLNLSVLFGAAEPYTRYGLTVFRAAVIVGIPVFAFIKDSWTDQIKNSPGWMWKGALGVWVYGVLTMSLLLFPRLGGWGQAVMMTGFPLGFEAIPCCVLYPVISQRYLTKPEITRRALRSLGMIALMAAGLLAYRAGYLRHPQM